MKKPRPADPMLDLVLVQLKHLPPKVISDQANGLVGANTIRNWRKGRVSRPQHYTLEAALRAVGLTFGIIERKKRR